MKLQKINQKSCLEEVRKIVDDIREQDLVERQLTLSKRDVYGLLVTKLETKLSQYQAELGKHKRLSWKINNWYDGVDLGKCILELRYNALRIWDGLNQGLM